MNPDALKELLKNESMFVSSQDEEEVFHQNDLVQLFPFGVSLGTESERPFLLLKNATQDLVLPVALNPMEAGLTLVQSNAALQPTTPHRFAQVLMESLQIKATQCVFVQIKGPHQFVRIYLAGHANTNSLKLRADEAMSLCLQLGIPIFATRGIIQRSKLMASEIEGLGRNLKQVPQGTQRNQTYLM